MEREICKINLTMTRDDDGSTTATGVLDFDGTGEDVVHFLSHFFEVLELSPVEAYIFSREAARQLKGQKEDEHGTE